MALSDVKIRNAKPRHTAPRLIKPISLSGALAKPDEKRRAAFTTAEEFGGLKKFGGLLRHRHFEAGRQPTVAALKLIARFFLRPGKLRQAEWTDFCSLDLALCVAFSSQCVNFLGGEVPQTLTKGLQPHRAR